MTDFIFARIISANFCLNFFLETDKGSCNNWVDFYWSICRKENTEPYCFG